MIRTIIVDDEPLSRDGIKLRLVSDKSIQIVGEYGNGLDAVNAINAYHPDLVFLDIQMPEMDGFEVIKNIGIDPLPFIIFITAYDKYAIEAFEIHALDYILKPINDVRFNKSIERVKEEILNRSILSFENKVKMFLSDYSHLNTTAKENTQSNQLEKIAIKSKGGYFLIDMNEINWIEAAGDYVYLHCNEKKHLHRVTMQNMEALLDSSKFQRIHRSMIVNINRVKEIKPSDHGDFNVYLCDGSKLKLSRNYKDSFLSVLKIPS